MEEERNKNNLRFFSRNWKVILIILGVIWLIILFIIFSGKTVVSPDLRYFPT